jgi:cold shock CspA family protein
MSDRQFGTIATIKEGYAFIQPDAGDQDIFTHRSGFRDRLAFRSMRPDQRVSFTVIIDTRGVKAVDVVIEG